MDGRTAKAVASLIDRIVRENSKITVDQVFTAITKLSKEVKIKVDLRKVCKELRKNYRYL